MERQETIIFGKSYSLGEEYESIKSRPEKCKFLGKYLKKDPDYSDVIVEKGSNLLLAHIQSVGWVRL
jgi:hypothetical protein